MSRRLARSFRNYPWLYILSVLVIGYVLISIFLTMGDDKISKVKTGIIVLGGGLKDDGTVPHHTQLRLDKAVELFKTQKESSYIITLSGGTPHKPNPRDAKGFAIWEATAAARKLIDMGISHTSILEENFSLDTIGNVSHFSIFYQWMHPLLYCRIGLFSPNHTCRSFTFT